MLLGRFFKLEEEDSCDGGQLSLDSTCCHADQSVACSSPPCDDADESGLFPNVVAFFFSLLTKCAYTQPTRYIRRYLILPTISDQKTSAVV